MKLRMKIQLFSLLFMLVMLLIVNTAIYFLFYKNATNSQLEQLANQTDVLVERLASNENPEETNTLINAYLPPNGMAKVFPESGQPLEFLFREAAFDRLEGEFSNVEKQEIVRPENGVIVAVVSKPIIWHNGEYRRQRHSYPHNNHSPTPVQSTVRALRRYFYFLKGRRANQILAVSVQFLFLP